jgi:hypothetical protein
MEKVISDTPKSGYRDYLSRVCKEIGKEAPGAR